MDRTKHKLRKAQELTVSAFTEIAYDTWLISLETPPGALHGFCPGQFCDIGVPRAGEKLLRRPFSIYRTFAEADELQLLIGVVGSGTRALVESLRWTETLNALLPLGHGFEIPDDARRLWIVGGGLGMGALGSVAQTYRDREIRGFFGFRSARYIPGKQHLPEGLASVDIATDDGSTGRRGFVTDLVASALAADRPDLILACGPSSMYSTLRDVTRAAGIPVQISVEERMGCGTGGCETCVCSVGGKYLKTCTDGPVFPLNEVDVYGG